MSTKEKDTYNPGLLGVSVHWFQTGLLSEIESTPGPGRSSKIYEVENLQDKDHHGVVRRKGATAMPH